jgi:hypothetical protein
VFPWYSTLFGGISFPSVGNSAECVTERYLNTGFDSGLLYGVGGHAHNDSREEGATPYPQCCAERCLTVWHRYRCLAYRLRLDLGHRRGQCSATGVMFNPYTHTLCVVSMGMGALRCLSRLRESVRGN